MLPWAVGFVCSTYLAAQGDEPLRAGGGLSPPGMTGIIIRRGAGPCIRDLGIAPRLLLVTHAYLAYLEELGARWSAELLYTWAIWRPGVAWIALDTLLAGP